MKRLACLSALALCTAALAASAHAAPIIIIPPCKIVHSYEVQTTADERDALFNSGAGPDGVWSLAETIWAANDDGTASVIHVPPGTYDLHSELTFESDCGLTVRGDSARSTRITGGVGYRRFVNQNTAGATIQGLGIRDARSADMGGGIYNTGTLTLIGDDLTGNEAANGGGVANVGGSLVITSSTLASNKALGDGASSAKGGAIYTDNTVTVGNSTISGNTADSSANGGFGGYGGAIYMPLSGGPGPPSFSHVESSTLVNNSAVGGVGGTAYKSVVEYRNSIVAGGSPANCEPGAMVSARGSISSDGTCFSEAAALNVDPRLGPLADNGGPTDTHALLAGSPAIDHAPTCDSPTPATDQRGIARPQGAACDIGAFELAPPGTPTSDPAGGGGGGGTTAQGLPGSVIAALGLNHARFRAFGSGPAIARAKPPRGATVSYTLTKAATVKFAVERAVRGHRKGGKCVTRRGVRGKRCTIFKTVGGFRHRGVAGQNHFLFRGRLRRRALKLGAYRLIANAAGATLTVKFRIVR